MSAGWVNYLTHPWVNSMIGDNPGVSAKPGPVRVLQITSDGG